MAEIGDTLREARMRARIDVSEIEAKTKIRAKYLRALENEEWDLLPGPTFVKSFLRTYATALELDGKALVEEYRLHFERSSEPPEPIVSSPQRVGARTQGQGPSRGYMALMGVVTVLIVLLIVGLLSGGGGSSKHRASTVTKTKHQPTQGRFPHRVLGAPLASTVVSLSLRATGAVYVCLIGEDGRKLVAGQTLEAGMRTATFKAKHFELTLGNNAVALVIDGTPRVVPASADAIGYSITKAGRKLLAPGHLPTCT